MRLLCLCTASTFDLVVKLVDITHSAHTCLQHESVVRHVIRCTPKYTDGGKCNTLFLKMNTTFPFNAVEGCSCLFSLCGLGVCAIALMNKKTTEKIGAKNYPYQLVLFANYKQFCLVLLSNPADVLWNANTVQRQPVFSVMFSFVHSNCTNFSKLMWK